MDQFFFFFCQAVYLFSLFLCSQWTERVSLVTESCLILCDSMGCSPPGSSVHGILQARVLECIAIPISSGSPQPRNPIQVSYVVGRFLTTWSTMEAHGLKSKTQNSSKFFSSSSLSSHPWEFHPDPWLSSFVYQANSSSFCRFINFLLPTLSLPTNMELSAIFSRAL